MKIVRFLLITTCLFALTACLSGGGTAASPVDDDTRVMAEVVVGSDGAISYTGSGSFEGFSFNATVPALAGRTVYIEKSDSAYVIGSYVSLSSKYSVRLTDTELALADTLYDVSVTLPYSAGILASEGGGTSDVVFCSLLNGVPVVSSSTMGAGSYITANVSFPFSYFAGYKKVVSVSSANIIALKGVSYKAALDAGDVLTDPASSQLADFVRGTRHIQPGEKAKLGIKETVFGETVATASWSITSKPAGSASILTADGDDMILIPDTEGTYVISLTATGVNGKTATDSITILAQNYSYSASVGDASCFYICHDGSFESSSHTDKYGRSLFRDIPAIWGASAHAGAFTPVAAETDTTCFQCHATGFLYTDRDENGTDEYAFADGYDDTITNWAAPATTGDAHLKNVKCEACHGPGTVTTGDFADVHYSDTTLGSDMCLACHDHGTITGHFFEYSTAHDNAYTLAGGTVAKNAECFKCHTAEGAMGVIFDKEFTPSNTDTVTGIGCSVCHDPHGEGGLDAQLRISGNFSIPLSTGAYTAAAGKGLVCYNCHNADATLPAVGSIPHNSQAEMVQGVGGYTYGTDLAAVKSEHGDLGLTCSDCHMSKSAGTTHQMLMTEGTAERIGGCTASCHATAPIFADGHYDYNGTMAAVRAKITQLQDLINTKAGLASGTAVRAFYTSGSEALNTALNNAAYNYNFILSDKSSGFHNPDYAETLVDLSLADLANY